MSLARPVLAIGEFLIDLIAVPPATSLLDANELAVRPGGAPANVAVALARQGVAAGLCAVVGDDPFGRRLLSVLEANQVDGRWVRQDGNADTTLAFAWKDRRGDGHFRLLRQADVLLEPSDIDRIGIERLEAIVVGSVSLSQQPSRSAIERATELADHAGVPICFDVNMRPTIWPNSRAARDACEQVLRRTDVLKLSLDDARFLFDLDTDAGVEAVMDRLAGRSMTSIVVTDGARGAWFANRDGDEFTAPAFVPAFPIDAIEPTGAGDAFLASIIVRSIERRWTWLAHEDIVYASAAGALTTTRPGAIDSLPTRDEIDRFLEGAER